MVSAEIKQLLPRLSVENIESDLEFYTFLEVYEVYPTIHFSPVAGSLLRSRRAGYQA